VHILWKRCFATSLRLLSLQTMVTPANKIPTVPTNHKALKQEVKARTGKTRARAEAESSGGEGIMGCFFLEECISCEIFPNRMSHLLKDLSALPPARFAVRTGTKKDVHPSETKFLAFLKERIIYKTF
jgi:hypothetical protein